MIEEIEHTADAGIRVIAGDIHELFHDAAIGMLRLICEDDKSQANQSLEIDIKANSVEKLLIKFLSEVLFIVQDNYFNPRGVDIVQIKNRHLKAIIHVNNNHTQIAEIKNVTYHNFKLEETDDGWLCEIIFDL